MSVKLYISEGIKKAELEIAKPNNLQLLNVILGLYGFFGVEIPGIGEQKPVSTQHVFEPNIQIPRAFEKTSQPREEKKSIELPKWQLPYVNGDRTLTQNLGEKLQPLNELMSRYQTFFQDLRKTQAQIEKIITSQQNRIYTPRARTDMQEAFERAKERKVTKV